MQHINLLDLALLARPAAHGLGKAIAGLAALSLAVAGHGALEWHQWQAAQQAALVWQAQAQGQALPGQSPAPAARGPSAGAGANAPLDPFANASGADPAAPGQPGTAANPALAQALQAESLLAALERESQALPKPGQTVQSIADALPANMWLTEIELRGPQQLRVVGGSLAPDALASFANQLAQQWQALGLPAPGLQTVRMEPAWLQADANGRPSLSTTAAHAAAVTSSNPVGEGPANTANAANAANGANAPKAPQPLPVHQFVLATATQASGQTDAGAASQSKP